MGLTNFLLTFDSSNAIDVVLYIVIHNDSVAEDVEVLSASLSFPDLPIQRVILNPNTTKAAIHDDDGIHNCYNIAMYSSHNIITV